MRHEDEDGHDAETTPSWSVECLFVCPEERQSEQPNDEGWWRAQEVCTVSAKRNWKRWMSNIDPVMVKFN